MLIYRLILKAGARRWRKAAGADVPTVCVGNVTAGGTGKTPFTELTLRLLQDSPRWGAANLAMLSRGYKRRSRGFQQVMRSSTAAFAGDEPLQIKKKFPAVTVAVDKNRIEGCDFLAHPEKLATGSFKAGKAAGMKRAAVRSARRCKDKELTAANIIVMDDALQYKRLHASLNIVLVDYNRPVFQDSLLPFGRLRDLPSRLWDADMIVVTKCPRNMDGWEKTTFASKLRIKDFNPMECTGTGPDGKLVTLLFSYTGYLPLEPVFPETDPRYSYSKSVVLFTGIADDTPVKARLSDDYKIVHSISFPDHHRFTGGDMSMLSAAVRRFPISTLVTTEKDAQRLLDCLSVPAEVRERVFMLPVETAFESERELEIYKAALDALA